MRLTSSATLLLAVCLLTACTEESNENEGYQRVQGGRAQIQETLVVVAPLTIGSVQEEVVISARVSSRTEVDVFPKLPALPVTEVLQEEGASVKEGDILMLLYDIDLKLLSQAAEAAFDEANRQKKLKGFSIESARTTLTNASRRAAITQRELERLEGLGDLVTQKEVDVARLASVTGETEVGDATGAVRTREIELELAEIAERRASLEWQRARQDVEATRVRSPADGVVAERNVDPGSLTTQASPAFRVVDTHDLILDLRVPQDNLARLAPGQTVTVTTTSLPGTRYTGIIRSVNPVLDRNTGTVHVRVDLDEDEGLVPGLFCQARIVTESRDGVLLVNKRAVLYDNNQPIIFAVDDEAMVARRIPFVAGASTATDVEIVEVLDGADLAPHHLIVIVGQDDLKGGATVRIVEKAF